MILLSPILDHWGLHLEFDIEREPGVALVESAGVAIPVNLPGRFADAGRDSGCALEAEAILASCEIGAGRVLVLADAALLDLHDPHPAAPRALAGLSGRAFAGFGDDVGRPSDSTN